MSERDESQGSEASNGLGSIDDLIGASSAGSGAPTAFTTAFRGYDRAEVDATISSLSAQLRTKDAEISDRVAEAQRLHDAENAAVRERHRADLDAAADELSRVKAELQAAEARAAEAEKRAHALGEEVLTAASTAEGADGEGKLHFEEILRVAEEQSAQLIRNASVQAERLLEAAHQDIEQRRKDADADAEQIRSQARHEAEQARLKIETELTAHTATIEREAAHAAEKVSQAEHEAATIRSDAEKGAAALRAMVARETEQERADAERAVREMRARVLEFEESLTRRQDDAQQEFLVLHNQAVAHAERITADANEQVQASLEHAQRISAKAEDFEKLVRTQAAQVEADAQLRSREHLDRAHEKAQRIIDSVSKHASDVLRDAEDRTRHLRWQQHQLGSFMAEVREMIRPEGSRSAAELESADASLDNAPAEPETADDDQARVTESPAYD